jgi:gliding motility-associated-like protein
MNRIKIEMNKNLLIVLAFLLFNMGYGQNVWLGGTSAWDIGTNWSYGQRPGNIDDVLIPNLPIQPIINAGAVCNSIILSNSLSSGVASLTVNGLGSLTVNSIEMIGTGSSSLRIGTGKVAVKGNVTMNGTALQNDVTFSGAGNLTIGGAMTGGTLNSGTGSVNYNAVTASQNVGAYAYNDLTLSGKGIKVISAVGTVVKDILSMEGTATVSNPPSYDQGATLQYNSAESHIVGPEWIKPFNCEGGIIIANTGVVTITGVDKYIGDGIPLTISTDAKLSITGGSSFYLGGNLINDGSLISDGFVYINGDDETQNIDGFTAKGVIMSKNAGTATFTQNMISGQLIINGLGTLSLGNGSRSLTHTFTDWVRTYGTLNGGTSLVKFSGNVAGDGGNFIAGTGTVEFNGGTQNLGTGSITYNNLTLSGVGTKTFGARTTINETISIADGVVANLTTDLVHTAKSIKLGAANGNGGSWGSLLSNAVNKNNLFFVSNNGIINVGPTIVISTDNLLGFTTTYGTPSVSKSFTISGIAMVEAVVIAAPLGFEVSKDGITFTDTVSVGGVGSFGDTTVFVRLKGTIDAKDYSGNIVLKSNGTSDVNITIAKSTVNKAPLTITAEKVDRTYGETNPIFTATYVGIIDGEKDTNIKSVTFNTIAVATSSVGDYPITVGGVTSSNYDIKFVPGTLTIKKATLTITAEKVDRTYGEANPTFTATYVGIIDGETDTNIKSVTFNTIAVATSSVGDYPITVGGVTSSNYDIKFVPGTLTIKMATLTITANKIKKTHGEVNPTFIATYVGIIDGETDTNLTKSVIFNTTATTTSGIGEYPIIVSGVISLNYTIKFVDGILDVIASSNADLSDIIINKGVLDPVFDMDQKGYTVVVPNETNSYVINPIPSNPNATVVMKVDGVIVDPTTPLDLKVGDNVITIEVTAEDGITKETYEVIVTREPSSNSGLTDLAISEGTLSPAFAEGIIAYTATVPYDIANITVTPITTDTTATVTVNGKEVPSGTASTDLPLKVGENTITTVVTAQDGTTTTYTVVVTREEAPLSSDAGLSDIVVSDGTLSPAFNTDTKGYSVDVPYETDSIIITPKAIDPDAKVEMIVDGVTITDNKSPIDLKVGENEITVVVTAPDGTQETYIVVVNRADAIPQAIIPTNIITPNGDGKNDFWIVPGLDKYPNNSVKVFDRAARLVYSKNNYNNEWDGTYKGSPLNEDTYYYLIDLGNGSPKMKGFISIIRNNN